MASGLFKTSTVAQQAREAVHDTNPPRSPRARWALRALAAAGGGGLLYLANPPRELWWLAPLAVAVLCLAVHGRRARAGFGYGLVFGLAWMLPLLRWLWDFLGPGFGPWPWLGVCLVCGLLFALPCAIMAVASTLPLAPVWMAATFVLGEAVRDRFPIGGFPWARLAFSQPSGALLPLASVGGAPLLTFAVALVGAGLAHLAVHRRDRRRLVTAAACALVPVVAGLALTPLVGAGPDAGRVRAMAVQGSGPDLGLNLLYAGDALWRYNQRQVARTTAAIAAGRTPRPDVVIVGESVVDLDGTRRGDLGPVRGLARAFGAPTAVGARSLPAAGQARNVVVGVDPRTGKTGEYTKQHLAPFGETVPLRSIARWFTPFVDSTSDMRPGTRPGVIPLGRARVGMAICFDVPYDDVLRGATNHGATLLAVPSNNAWYGHSEMTYQQQAMSRIRAVEHDRSVVIAATTGSSALIRPDGSIIERSGQFVPASLSAQVPLRTGTTLADTLGPWPEWVLAAVGIIGLVFGARARARRKGAGGEDERAGG